MRGILPRGMSQRQHWLVIPLTAALHAVGPEAIDGELGVVGWESRFGTQLQHLLWVERQTGIDAFFLAGIPHPTGEDS